jgi:hypothetical protein
MVVRQFLLVQEYRKIWLRRRVEGLEAAPGIVDNLRRIDDSL